MSLFYVERQCWQRWPKTLIVVKENDHGDERRRYVPERTCHMELRKLGATYDVFYFDCCDEEYAESRTDRASCISGKVCPYCGARVKEGQ